MIKVYRDLTSFNKGRSSIPSNVNIGFVPTMGNLHLGHLKLLEASLKNNSHTIISIFVNPKQFADNEDFGDYPKTLDQDLKKIRDLSSNFTGSKEVLVFAPINPEEVYPKGFSTTITLGPLTKILCGKNRPDHFDGVTTVVYRLLKITSPTIAYFGQKDYQQAFLINKMVKDLSLETNIEILPIIRDENGLALSSRNQYLKNNEKLESLVLFKTLNELRSFIQTNESWQESLQEMIELHLKKENWDYLEVLDAKDLRPISKKTSKVLIACALKIGKTRLIDNILVESPHA